MHAVIQGLILGFIIVLPGMSGGTVFLIMGLYENLVADLVRLNLRPYVPIFGGMFLGIYIGGTAFAIVFQSHRDVTVAFLLGCLLASIRSVLASCPEFSAKRAACLLVGLLAGLYMGVEPLAVANELGNISPLLLFVGGALGTAAMVIPGVPGSSVLIVLGLYDTMLYYIKELVFGQLALFLAGSVFGLFLLVRLLDRLYAQYKDLLSYFFAGLIVGSSRALMPYTFSLTLVPVFVAGFSIVWVWSGRKVKTNPSNAHKANAEEELAEVKTVLTPSN